MNKFAIAVFLLVSSFASNAKNLSDQDINIAAASLKAVTIYQAGGMTGLFNGMNQCYTQLKQNKSPPRKEIEFCVTLDMSGVFLDYSMAQMGGFPRDQRFTNEVASSRMHIMLEQLGVSKSIADTQKYLGSRNERVQRFTNNAATVAADSASKSESPDKCVDREMAKWEKQREKEISEWCADLAKKGQECTISAGQEELVWQEALEKIKAQCR
jgi:hypothetical protein